MEYDMIKPIPFAKLSGSGNDFICIDNRNGCFDKLLADQKTISHFAKTLCHRRMGIGADGVIFAGRPEIDGFSDIGARFFEADGSEAELCGNGTGCFVHWIIAHGWASKDDAKIFTSAGVVHGHDLENPYVRVCIPDPEELRMDFPLCVFHTSLQCHYAVTGVPHVIHYVDDIEQTDVNRLGPAIRHHRAFQPRGANANFVQVLGEGELAIRTWEFGVEDETLACGTGSAAAAIISAIQLGWDSDYANGKKPILLHARSGDVLRVYFHRMPEGSVTDVCLETVVRYLYDGTIHPDLANRALSQR